MIFQVKSGFAGEEDLKIIVRLMRERVAQVKRERERKAAEAQQPMGPPNVANMANAIPGNMANPNSQSQMLSLGLTQSLVQAMAGQPTAPPTHTSFGGFEHTGKVSFSHTFSHFNGDL